jgi:hypothetical protein
VSQVSLATWSNISHDSSFTNQSLNFNLRLSGDIINCLIDFEFFSFKDFSHTCEVQLYFLFHGLFLEL